MKRKINMKPQELSSQEITSLKNFNQINQKIKEQKERKRNILKRSIAAVVIIGLTTFTFIRMSDSGNSQKVDNSSNKKQPVPTNIDNKLSVESFFVNNQEGGVVKTTDDYRFVFDKDAIVDGAGNTVQGEFEVKIQTYTDAVDFMLSGIPMTYDSAGKQYLFESAGMFKMEAFKDGEKLKLKKGANVKVDMPSPDISRKYNLYKYDEKVNNWNHLGKDNVSLNLDSLSQGKVDEQVFDNLQKWGVLENEQPNKPQKAAPIEEGSYVFDIDVLSKEFPQMKPFRKSMFQAEPSLVETQMKKNFDGKSLYDIEWNNIELLPNETSNGYQMKLSKVVGASVSEEGVEDVVNNPAQVVVPKKVSRFGVYKSFSENKKVDLDNGINVIMVGSMTCRDCQNVYKDLHDIKTSKEDFPFYLIGYGAQTDASYFFKAVDDKKTPYTLVRDINELVKLCDGKDDIPMVFIVNNGDIVYKKSFKIYDADKLTTSYNEFLQTYKNQTINLTVGSDAYTAPAVTKNSVNWSKSVVFPVTLVSDGNSEKEFEQNMLIYNKKVAEIRVEQERIAQELKKRQEELRKKWQAQQAERQRLRKARNQMAYWEVRRTFSIYSFGVYNSDSPMRISKNVSGKGKVYIDSKLYQNPTNYVLYEIKHSANSLMCHYTNYSNVAFNTTTPSTCFMIKDNKLCFMDEDRFKKLKVKDGIVKVDLKSTDKEVKTPNELRAALGLLYNNDDK